MLFSENHDYQVQLPDFEGPLDLLLRLIEREELDITVIALAQVADQYLAHVRQMESPDPGSLSAFLVIAARLLVIKSRALLPRPQAARGPDEPPDEGEQLARQLREYQRYKQAAALLRGWEEQGRRTYTRLAAPPAPVRPANQQIEVTVSEMIAAVQRRMQLLLPFDPPLSALPMPKAITVAEMAEKIHSRLQVQQWIDFEDLLSLAVQRVEVIVGLWAVLELLKRQAIVAEQPKLFGPIMIGRGPNFGAAPLHSLTMDVTDESAG